MSGRLSDEEIAVLEERAKAVLERIEATQSELETLARERREVVRELSRQLGQSETSRRLGITRQAVWNMVNQK